MHKIEYAMEIVKIAHLCNYDVARMFKVIRNIHEHAEYDAVKYVFNKLVRQGSIKLPAKGLD